MFTSISIFHKFLVGEELLECDDIVPLCASSLHDTPDFAQCVLGSVSCNARLE